MSFRDLPHGKGYGTKCLSGKPHKWQPLSFVFETQMLDDNGRPVVKQPAIQNAKVYCVCMKCAHHTYIETDWVGYYLGGPDRSENLGVTKECGEGG